MSYEIWDRPNDFAYPYEVVQTNDDETDVGTMGVFPHRTLAETYRNALEQIHGENHDLTDEQNATINDLFSGMAYRYFVCSDGNVVVDCGDGRPVVVGIDGKWHFLHDGGRQNATN